MRASTWQERVKGPTPNRVMLLTSPRIEWATSGWGWVRRWYLGHDLGGQKIQLNWHPGDWWGVAEKPSHIQTVPLFRYSRGSWMSQSSWNACPLGSSVVSRGNDDANLVCFSGKKWKIRRERETRWSQSRRKMAEERAKVKWCSARLGGGKRTFDSGCCLFLNPLHIILQSFTKRLFLGCENWVWIFREWPIAVFWQPAASGRTMLQKLKRT